MSTANSRPRRGAPRPLPTGEMKPPSYLTASQKELFRAAVRGRDGYWLESDSILLAAYAVTADWVQNAHIGAEVQPGAYVKALKALYEIMRVLRISPVARDTGNDAVAPPLGLGDEGTAEFLARQRGEAPARPDMPPAWQRASEQADAA